MTFILLSYIRIEFIVLKFEGIQMTHLNPIIKIQKKVYKQYHLHITLTQPHHYSED